MPSNGQFGFSVLVGNKPLPEYNHPNDSSRVLVESILWSPVTYWLPIKEYCKASDEIETQKWPVTPYEIKVYQEPACRKMHCYKLFVDGTQVTRFWLKDGESKIVSGFKDSNSHDGSYREFLFSLPRFANDADDRVDKERSCKIGKIEVVCCETTFSHKKVETPQKKTREVKFDQANKKDVLDVTKKEYCMATTKVGRLLKNGKPYDRPKDTEQPNMPREVNVWNIGDEVGKVSVEYHMTQTLLDWGIQRIIPDWPQKGGSSEMLQVDAKKEK